jgi:hypothetical protein
MQRLEFAMKGSQPTKSKSVKGAKEEGVRLMMQMGTAGPDAVEAARALYELGKRQKVGKRLGAEAVIKAERR